MKVHAPYNFVPLNDKVIPSPLTFDEISHDMPLKDGLCGTIAFNITAQTPLCVGGERQGASADAPGNVQMFTAIDGTNSYAIPGSTIRGAMRNVVEIMTGSAMQFVDDARYAVRDLTNQPAGKNYRSHFVHPPKNNVNAPNKSGRNVSGQGFAPKVLGGFLEFTNGAWALRPCNYSRVEQESVLCRKEDPVKQSEKLASFRRTQTILNEAPRKYEVWEQFGHPIRTWFRVLRPYGWQPHVRETRDGSQDYFLEYETVGWGNKDNSDHFIGVLVFTGQPSDKKHLEFVFHHPEDDAIPVPQAVLRRFLEVQDDKKRKQNGDGATTWEYLVERNRRDPKLPIPIFWLQGRRDEILEIGTAQLFPMPLKNRISNVAAKTQRGLTNANQIDWAEAIFGRVVEVGTQNLKGRVSFSLCAGDYKGSTTAQAVEGGRGGILSNPKSSFYAAYLKPSAQGKAVDYDQPGAKLRGWKRYPARSQAKVQKPEGELANKRKIQTVLHTVPKNTRFSGKLRFHNLSQAELGCLLWVMTFDGQSNLRHSIGTGKPWGFGQVEIAVDMHASSIVPNDIDGAVPQLDVLKQAFTTAIEAAAPSWMDSESINALLAMANPAKGDAVAKTHPLAYMSLEQHVLAKKDGDALPDFPREN